MTKTILETLSPYGLPLRDTVGDDLYRKGYLISVRNSQTLWIEKADLTAYVLNPRMDSCTCPAGSRGVECKHKRGLMELLFLSADYWHSIGEHQAGHDLVQWWSDYCFWCEA